ncbi:MFS transporter [Candidatus Aerophobetes bacterium]|nr:MFS transporter [Candidatus Aerophobetes bacterium]
MFLDHRLPSWIRANYYYDSLGGLFYGAFYGLAISFFPYVARKIGAEDFSLALLTASTFIGALLAAYWGHRSSKLTRKVSFIVKIKVAARIFLAVLIGISSLPAFYITVILIYWIIEFIADPAYAQTMKEIYPGAHRGRALGYVRTEMALVAIVFTYLGGVLLDITSYRIIFPLGAGLGILSSLSFRKIKEDFSNKKKVGAAAPSSSFFRTIKLPLRDKRFLLYTSISFLGGAGSLLVLPLYPIYLVSYLNFSNYSIGKLGALFSLMWMFSYIFWGEILAGKKPTYVLAFVYILASLVPLFYYIERNIWFLAVASSLSGFTSGGLDLGRITYITRNYSIQKLPFYSGADTSFMGIRGIIFPFMGIGLMRLWGIKTAFLFAFLFMLVSGVLTWYLKNKLEGSEEEN